MAGLMAVSTLAVPAGAAPGGQGASGEMILAQGDCYSIGMQEARRRGGQLGRATLETRGGRQVCVIVVLMPAKDGQRPRRSEIVVPLN